MTRIEEIIGMKNPCKNCSKDIEDCAKTHSLCEKGDEYWRNAAKSYPGVDRQDADYIRFHDLWLLNLLPHQYRESEE